MGGKHRLVDAWFVVVAFHLTDAGQFAEVAVPLLVLGQQHQVTGALLSSGVLSASVRGAT
jgi:hypothetical protein